MLKAVPVASRLVRFGWLVAFMALACGGKKPSQHPPEPILLGVGGASDGGPEPAAGGAETGSPQPGDGPALPCNTWTALCDRPYDQVTFPTTHASMADSAAFWDYPAQGADIRAQLDNSIRGLMLEVHEDRGTLMLCASSCTEGRTPFAAELAQVAGFLADNPREIVTLLIDNRVPALDVAQALAAADLERSLYTDDPSGGWPTLGQMVDADMRLVVFLNDAEGAPLGYRSLTATVGATTAVAHSARELDCTLVSGPSAPSLILMNDFLVTDAGALAGAGGEGGAANSGGRPDAALADTVNHEPFMSEALGHCVEYNGKPPSFVAVDFFDTSDVIEATQRLSGLIK